MKGPRLFSFRVGARAVKIMPLAPRSDDRVRLKGDLPEQTRDRLNVTRTGNSWSNPKAAVRGGKHSR